MTCLHLGDFIPICNPSTYQQVLSLSNRSTSSRTLLVSTDCQPSYQRYLASPPTLNSTHFRTTILTLPCLVSDQCKSQIAPMRSLIDRTLHDLHFGGGEGNTTVHAPHQQKSHTKLLRLFPLLASSSPRNPDTHTHHISFPPKRNGDTAFIDFDIEEGSNDRKESRGGSCGSVGRWVPEIQAR